MALTALRESRGAQPPVTDDVLNNDGSDPTNPINRLHLRDGLRS
jgi:hypothetical protein